MVLAQLFALFVNTRVLFDIWISDLLLPILLHVNPIDRPRPLGVLLLLYRDYRRRRYLRQVALLRDGRDVSVGLVLVQTLIFVLDRVFGGAGFSNLA